MVKHHTFEKLLDEQTREVHIRSKISANDYDATGSGRDIALLKTYSEALRGKKIIFVNATAEGGGVAIMRAPLIALLQSVGIDAHWYVLTPDQAAFDITKHKFHNVLQGVANPEVHLTTADKEIYNRWIEHNARTLREPLSSADVIVIDDWQPSGLIPFIKGSTKKPGYNPDAKILFRDHIQTEGKLMSTPGTPQHTTWDFIWNHNQVKRADDFITHPKDEFVPPDVPNEKVVFMPATSDPLDDLNRPLTHIESLVGLGFINAQLQKNEQQKPLTTSRRYIALIARFDPSKGMPIALEAYARAHDMMRSHGLRTEQIPQLAIIGNGSVDDPDGKPLLDEMMRLRREKYWHIKDDIKIARVPANDIAINALLRHSSLALQPSTKEGFESRVTDAILQGIPVLGSSRGGIPLQIVPGQSGYVLDPEDIQAWVDKIYALMTDHIAYERLCESTRLLAKAHNYEFTTVPNALNWLFLSHTLMTQPGFSGDRQWVRDLRANSIPLVNTTPEGDPQHTGFVPQPEV